MCPDHSKAMSKVMHKPSSTRRLGISDATFRALIENSSDGLALFDSEWNITYASSATERILGFSPAEILQSSRFTLVHPDDLIQIRSRMEECLAGRGTAVQM